MVGSERRVFTIHEDVLVQCSRKFRLKENISKHYVLEDDDPVLFRYLLDFLYRGEYDSKIDKEAAASTGSLSAETGQSLDDDDVRIRECQRHARLYCLADKYGIKDMKVQAISKLEMLAPIPLPSLVDIAAEMYDRMMPSCGQDFRDFFTRQACQLHIADAVGEPWLLAKVASGGILAQDILVASTMHSENSLKKKKKGRSGWGYN